MTVDWTLVIQVITATTALIAVVVGPLATLKVAQRQSTDAAAASLLQARTDVISKNRQDWINKLRDELASFLAESIHTSTLVQAKTSPVSNHNEHVFFSMQRLLTGRYRVKLLLNPAKSDHIAVVKVVDAIYSNMLEKEFDFSSAQQQLVSLSQALLKKEWERVKQFT